MKKTGKTKGKEQVSEKKKRTWLYAAAGIAACIIIALFVLIALNSVPAKEGDKVSVFYVGMLDNGSVFDSNVNRTPLTFTIGAHTVIPGFENAVIGMKKGEVKTVLIPPEQAYGLYRNDLVYTVNRTEFTSDTPPAPGLYYTVTNPKYNTTSRVKIVNVTDSTVTIDANHMLAGQNLTFVIHLVGIF